MATPMSARVERGGVVDAVAGHGDDVALALEHVDEAHLVLRCDPCDDADVPDLGVELFVAQGRELGAGKGTALDSELSGNRGRRRHVVAGDHPCANARFLTARDRVPRLLARRVDDGHQGEQRQPLDLFEQRAVRIERGRVDVP
jgi:hypothetical protein